MDSGADLLQGPGGRRLRDLPGESIREDQREEHSKSTFDTGDSGKQTQYKVQSAEEVFIRQTAESG